MELCEQPDFINMDAWDLPQLIDTLEREVKKYSQFVERNPEGVWKDRAKEALETSHIGYVDELHHWYCKIASRALSVYCDKDADSDKILKEYCPLVKRAEELLDEMMAIRVQLD